MWEKRAYGPITMYAKKSPRAQFVKTAISEPVSPTITLGEFSEVIQTLLHSVAEQRVEAVAVPLPTKRLLRLKQIIGNPKAAPPIKPRIPISASSWWAGIKAGIYPPGIKLSPRVTVWSEDDIDALIVKSHQRGSK